MNVQDRRVIERMHKDLAQRIGRVEKKQDWQAEKCVGCSREFGEMATEQANLGERVKAHEEGHHRRAALVAAVAGLVVAVVAGFVNWIRGS